jgi:hypothetical protein
MFRRPFPPQKFQTLDVLRGIVETVGNQEKPSFNYNCILIKSAISNVTELIQVGLTPLPSSLRSGASHSKGASMLWGDPLFLRPDLQDLIASALMGGVIFRF